jgi:hypothetical protein
MNCTNKEKARIEFRSSECQVIEVSLLQRKHLSDLFNKCRDLYFPRLKTISESIFKNAVIEYSNSIPKILDRLIELDPLNVSLSVSANASLHYIFRFRNNKILFLETFLEETKSNDSYFELYGNEKKLLYASKESIEDGMQEVAPLIKETKELEQSDIRNYKQKSCIPAN